MRSQKLLRAVIETLEHRQMLSGTVQNLGELVGPMDVKGSLASSGSTATYQLQLKHPGWISALILGGGAIGASVTSEISGNGVDLKTGPADRLGPNLVATETAANRLAAGSYNVTVTRRDSANNVKGAVSFFMRMAVDCAGSNTATALEAGKLTSTQTFKGYVNTIADIADSWTDLYHFTVSQPSRVTASVVTAVGDAVSLYAIENGQSVSLAVAQANADGSATVTANAPPGDVYVLVTKRNNLTPQPPYTLTTNAAAANVASLKIISGSDLVGAGSTVRLVGVALDASGKPVPGAAVGVEDAVVSQSRSLGNTDGNGQFALTYTAAQTTAAGEGLYLSELHSGNADLYVKLGVSARGYAQALIPGAGVDLTPVSNASMLDETTLVMATKAPSLVASLVPTRAQVQDVASKVADGLQAWAANASSEFSSNPLNLWAIAGASTCVELPGNPICDLSLAYLSEQVVSTAISSFVHTVIERVPGLSEGERKELTLGFDAGKVFVAFGAFNLDDVDTIRGAFETGTKAIDLARDAKDVSKQTAEVFRDAQGRVKEVETTNTESNGNTLPLIFVPRSPLGII